MQVGRRRCSCRSADPRPHVAFLRLAGCRSRRPADAAGSDLIKTSRVPSAGLHLRRSAPMIGCRLALAGADCRHVST